MPQQREATPKKKDWSPPRLDRLGTIADVAGKPPPILQGGASKS